MKNASVYSRSRRYIARVNEWESLSLDSKLLISYLKIIVTRERERWRVEMCVWEKEGRLVDEQMDVIIAKRTMQLGQVHIRIVQKSVSKSTGEKRSPWGESSYIFTRMHVFMCYLFFSHSFYVTGKSLRCWFSRCTHTILYLGKYIVKKPHVMRGEVSFEGIILLEV